jgi:hypothetical protein
MRYFFIILSVLLLTSCGSYRIQKRQPEISHLLALTTEGDTIKVPIQELQRDLTPDYYSGYRFYWNNSWWLYNDWYWNYYYQNPRWFYPRTQIIVPNNRIRVQTPRYTPQRQLPNKYPSRTPQVQPNRGRSNQVRQPQYVRPSNTRTQSTPTRSNPQSRTTSSGRVIKQ